MPAARISRLKPVAQLGGTCLSSQVTYKINLNTQDGAKQFNSLQWFPNFSNLVFSNRSTHVGNFIQMALKCYFYEKSLCATVLRL